MDAEFDTWNEIKKRINNKTKNLPFPQEREVWMSFVGKNVGFEQNGAGRSFSRPILIFKKFNNNMFWVMPLSSKQKELNYYYNFLDVNNRSASVIIAQLKLVSIKRLNRKLYELPFHHFTNIKNITSKFIVSTGL